jgi:hypothetical protein
LSGIVGGSQQCDPDRQCRRGKNNAADPDGTFKTGRDHDRQQRDEQPAALPAEAR